MAKAVFTTKISPVYDDLPEVRYHFPRTYLRQVEAALNDWIIYYEPRRATGDLSSHGGRQSYFATAHVDRIREDASRPDQRRMLPMRSVPPPPPPYPGFLFHCYSEAYCEPRWPAV